MTKHNKPQDDVDTVVQKLCAELELLRTLMAGQSAAHKQAVPTKASALASARVYARKAVTALKHNRPVDADHHAYTSLQYLESSIIGLAEDSQIRSLFLKAIDDLSVVRDVLVLKRLQKTRPNLMAERREDLKKRGDAIRLERQRLRGELAKLDEADREVKRKHLVLRRVTAFLRS